MSILKRQLSAISIAAATGTLAQPVLAQDAGWTSAWDITCNKVHASLADNMEQLRTPRVHMPVAHRGVYSVPLPNGTQYAAENTILAFQYVQCLGYAGVEVDIKHTHDGVIVLGHDRNMMRFTNIDDFDGNYNLDRDAGVINNGTRRNPATVNNVPIAALDFRYISWSSIDDQLQYVKTYDGNGHYHGNVNIINNNSMRLDYVLSQASLSGSGMDKLVWVLDIQSHADLIRCLEIVGDLHMWDRVIFKVWATAIPVIFGDSVYYAHFPQEYPAARFVISINAGNSTYTDGNLETYVFLHGHVSSLPEEIVYDVFSNFKSTTGADIYGFEFFIGAEDNNKDQALEFWSDRYKSLAPGWGVIRQRDYLQFNCAAQSDPRRQCNMFPDGEYYVQQKHFHHDTHHTYLDFHVIDENVARARQYFGFGYGHALTADVRAKSSINTPRQYGAFIAALE